MVKTIYTENYRTSSELSWAGNPVIELHHIERHVHGNGIAIKVWGEMKVSGKQTVFARELGLNTLQVLLLNTETGAHNLFHAQKQIYHKGENDNWASIDILGPGSGEAQFLNDGGVWQASAAELPTDGSIWLDFHALGE